MNCEYKIAAKAVAGHLKKALPDIINHDQTGFLKGRFIGENIRLLNSVISYTEREKIPGLFLFVDFEKAFDTLEWPFVIKTLSHFGFGKSFISWITLFYTDISSSVQNNGWASDLFTLGRGVRQGCPLSPYLFILAAEVLGNAITNHKEIKGINMLGTECKLISAIFVRARFLCDNLWPESRLRKNPEALWIGSLRFQSNKITTKHNVK